jgi:hypothetical protein
MLAEHRGRLLTRYTVWTRHTIMPMVLPVGTAGHREHGHSVYSQQSAQEPKGSLHHHACQGGAAGRSDMGAARRGPQPCILGRVAAPTRTRCCSTAPLACNSRGAETPVPRRVFKAIEPTKKAPPDAANIALHTSSSDPAQASRRLRLKAQPRPAAGAPSPRNREAAAQRTDNPAAQLTKALPQGSVAACRWAHRPAHTSRLQHRKAGRWVRS